MIDKKDGRIGMDFCCKLYLIENEIRVMRVTRKHKVLCPAGIGIKKIIFFSKSLITITKNLVPNHRIVTGIHICKFVW